MSPAAMVSTGDMRSKEMEAKHELSRKDTLKSFHDDGLATDVFLKK